MNVLGNLKIRNLWSWWTLTVTESLRDEVDKKSTRQACLTDLQKAFETRYHGILLNKLKEDGLRGDVNNLVRSYFRNRVQHVCSDGKFTNNCEIKISVPQGSILGPLLYLLNINHLTSCVVHPKIVCFADDTIQVTEGME